MSVVCAKVYNDKIVVAADSVVIYDDRSKDTKKDFIKLTKINDIIIGGSGNCEELSIMQHYVKTHKPSNADEKSVLEYMVEFSKWKNDFINIYGVENDYIIAFDGKLFRSCGLFINEIKDYCAIGAGMDFANAALYLGHSPKEAVKVACELSCYVAEPINEEIILKF